MKIISLIGVFLICGLSFPPNAPKDTPINLNITKKEATITEMPRDKICLPIWNVFVPEKPFVYSASIIFDNFNIDYDTVDNTFNEITLNNFSFDTTLEIISIDYDNTIEVQYTTTIPTAVYINQNITFNNNYGEIGFAGSLKLLNTSNVIGIGPLYQGNIYLIYISFGAQNLIYFFLLDEAFLDDRKAVFGKIRAHKLGMRHRLENEADRAIAHEGCI